MKHRWILNQFPLLVFCCGAFVPGALEAQISTYSQTVSADTFVSSGEPDLNFGSRGAMEIAAPTATQPRTQIALLRFETAAMRAAFDADYGVGNWAVTSVSLSLSSSVATAGQQPNNNSFNRIAAGDFEFALLSNDGWSETGITWNTLPGILPGSGNDNASTPLGNFFWPANGAASSVWTLNLDALLLNEIYNGDTLTLLGQPTIGSAVGYLFNTFPGNPGHLDVAVQAVPEPSVWAVIACAVAGLATRRVLTAKVCGPAPDGIN